MEYLLEVHTGHTLLAILAIGIVIGMFLTLWLDDQYQKEEQERKERDHARIKNKYHN